jgi:C-terminal processing protease CtpA/Prc
MLRRFLIPPLISMASLAAGAQDAPPAGAPVQLAPVTVKAGPLAFIGIRCAVTVGFFGFVSSDARIKDLVILDVLADSPAQRAGLLARDRVLRIDGVPVTDCTVGDLRRIGEKEKGDRIEFEVSSPDSKAPRSVEVTLGVRKIPLGPQAPGGRINP